MGDAPDRHDDDPRNPAPAEAMPIAPTEAEWRGLSAEEKARRVEEIILSIPLSETMSEGTPHSRAKRQATDTLDLYFSRIRKGIFIADELSVLYPGEPVFVPDLLAVLDVPLHDRMAWTVVDEGKGVDFILEVQNASPSKKDHVRNVERYARLGIREYFTYDCRRQIVRGHRLADPSERKYEMIAPQVGRFPSVVLGVEMAVVDGRLRFYKDEAEIPAALDLIARLSQMVNEREEQIGAAEAQVKAAEAQIKAAEARAEQAGQAELGLRQTLRETLLAVLAARGISLDGAGQERIAGCDDAALLSRWITRAATAAGVEEVFTA